MVFRGLFGWFILFFVWGVFCCFVGLGYFFAYNTKGTKQDYHQEQFLATPALPPQGTPSLALLIYFCS